MLDKRVFFQKYMNSAYSHNIPYEKIGDEVVPLDVPFDIPDSWEWVRLGLVSTYAETKEKVNAQNANPELWGLDLEDIEKGGRLLCKKKVGERRAVGDKTHFSKGDILYSKLRPYLLKILVADDDGICTPEIVPFKMYGNINSTYIVYYLQSPYVDNYINSITYGVKMPRVGTETMTDLLVPIPPIEEQDRIVSKIQEVEPFVFQYNEVNSQNRKLNLQFPERLRKSILQWAVQGKLVPQDENDEPAEILLERVRAEKETLIKAGKIKRDKHESVIFRRDNSHYEKRGPDEICIDSELPFTIPSTWAWCRISTIGNIVRGSGIKRTETTESGLPCVRYGEIYTSYNVSFEETKSFISPTLDKQCKHFAHGDIVFTLTGENKPDIAKAVAYMGNTPVAAGGDLAYWEHHGMNPLYLVFLMASPYVINCKVELATGDIIVHISGDKIGSILVPIPPLKEQERIVARILEMFQLCKDF